MDDWFTWFTALPQPIRDVLTGSSGDLVAQAAARLIGEASGKVRRLPRRDATPAPAGRRQPECAQPQPGPRTDGQGGRTADRPDDLPTYPARPTCTSTRLAWTVSSPCPVYPACASAKSKAEEAEDYPWRGPFAA